jgi:ABC-type antimicrobial peptide transport system permease subunit
VHELRVPVRQSYSEVHGKRYVELQLSIAGIGIMNIIIVPLIERTREIGILKALGMKSLTVLMIFLGESVIIGVIDAMLCIGLRWILANLVAVAVSEGGSFSGIGGGQTSGLGVSLIFVVYCMAGFKA